MKTLFIIFATFLSISAFAQVSDVQLCIEQNDSTVGMEQCQHDEYLRLKNVLTSEYIKLRETRVKDAQHIINSHISWALKTEAACTDEVADREGGTSQGFAKAECLSEKTQLRIDYIRALPSAEKSSN